MKLICQSKHGFQLRRKSTQIENFLAIQMPLIRMLLLAVVNSRKQNVVVNDGPVDRGFTFIISGIFSTTDEKTMSVQTLERCSNEKIDRHLGNIVDTVENRIQNAILTAIDNIITPRVELAVWSINAPFGRDRS